jgi:hypothetical protein
MNWEAIGAFGEVIGALAVIGTLFYLARQIRQSTSTSQVSMNQTLTKSFETINDLVLSNPHIIETLKAVENPSRGGGRNDSVVLRHLSYRWTNVWMAAEVAYQRGQLSDEEFEVYKDDFKNILDLYPALVEALIEELVVYPSMQQYEIFAPISARVAGSR